MTKRKESYFIFECTLNQKRYRIEGLILESSGRGSWPDENGTLWKSGEI